MPLEQRAAGCNGNKSGISRLSIERLYPPLGTFKGRSTAHQAEVGWR